MFTPNAKHIAINESDETRSCDDGVSRVEEEEEENGDDEKLLLYFKFINMCLAHTSLHRLTLLLLLLLLFHHCQQKSNFFFCVFLSSTRNPNFKSRLHQSLRGRPSQILQLRPHQPILGLHLTRLPPSL